MGTPQFSACEVGRVETPRVPCPACRPDSPGERNTCLSPRLPSPSPSRPPGWKETAEGSSLPGCGRLLFRCARAEAGRLGAAFRTRRPLPGTAGDPSARRFPPAGQPRPRLPGQQSMNIPEARRGQKTLSNASSSRGPPFHARNPARRGLDTSQYRAPKPSPCAARWCYLSGGVLWVSLGGRGTWKTSPELKI
ncbi:collagen alpha-1(XXII) chain-like [Trachypithecus francoisi]|uniref:collagen alpha-1(XXII) chain-like n=1 Tax=Trachypithecus francoisi TaxID=54180 RepID=UPI00141A6DE5|nr:collagen alpha-1(XXII) chain-like [Trachypithecus francoisi]